MCGKMGGCTAAKVGWWVILVGALNWGLVGLGGWFGNNWNVVNLLLGAWPWLESLVYVAVGLAAVGALVGCKCKECSKECAVDKK